MIWQIYSLSPLQHACNRSGRLGRRGGLVAATRPVQEYTFSLQHESLSVESCFMPTCIRAYPLDGELVT